MDVPNRDMSMHHENHPDTGATRIAPARHAHRPGLGRIAALVAFVAVMPGLSGAARAAAPPPRCAATDRLPAQDVARLAPGVWLLRGAAGDTTEANRGAISNLLAVRDGARLWLVGSGPSPAHGRRVACTLRAVAGRAVTDLIAPWPRPELVLGQAAWPQARRWAHADVAAAMRTRCPGCIERLGRRLGGASGDLGDGRPAWPTRLLHGDAGRLGPWSWTRLARGHGTPVTVWRLPRLGLAAAHGLLWGDGAPDLRDGERAVIAASLARLRDGSADCRAGWVPEQGPMLGCDAPAAHLDYLDALVRAIAGAQARGALETDAPEPARLPVPARAEAAVRHDLNWQHVWREEEAGAFGDPAAARP